MEELRKVDQEIFKCKLCFDMVEKFPNSKTVSIGRNSNIVILGEAPANNGWRKSGVAWYDVNHKLLPHLFKCYPKDRKHLNKCGNNCRQFLFKQLDIINPKIVLALGDSATKTILNIKYKKFSDVVGKEFEVNGFKVIPIYHPSPISPLSYKGNEEIFKNLKL